MIFSKIKTIIFDFLRIREISICSAIKNVYADHKIHFSKIFKTRKIINLKITYSRKTSPIRNRKIINLNITYSRKTSPIRTRKIINLKITYSRATGK